MIDRDLIETFIALALILACAATAIATTKPPREERPLRGNREKRKPPIVDPVPVDTAVLAPAVETAPAPEVLTPGTARARPRILTGEPAAPEPPRAAARRAVALVAGITALAAGGAVGLLVVVRALVAMFKKIGG